jgi:hypothetical protein
MASLGGFTPIVAKGLSHDAGLSQLPKTIQADQNVAALDAEDLDFNLNAQGPVTVTPGALFIKNQPLPPLPLKMSPAQAARVAEIFDLLHRGLSSATENIDANEDGTQVTLNFADWQKVMAVQMLLALYLRAVTDPDSLNQET